MSNLYVKFDDVRAILEKLVEDTPPMNQMRVMEAVVEVLEKCDPTAMSGETHSRIFREALSKAFGPQPDDQRAKRIAQSRKRN